MATEGIRVEGVRELTSALNKAGSKDLTKEMGQANKQIGQTIIDRLSPKPVTVGTGAGARVRPSASARLVQLKAGGKHRALPETAARWGSMKQTPWGRVPNANRATRRPNILGTALKVYPTIEKDYLDAIDRILNKVGRKT
jgi:hypothetical protein